MSKRIEQACPEREIPENVFEQDFDAATGTQLDLGEISRFLVHVREEERKQIGRELHDEVAQSLCLAELWLEKAYQSADPGVRPHLDQVWELLQEASREIKEISWNLKPSFNSGELLSVIKELIRRYTLRGELDIKLNHSGLEQPLPGEVTVAAYWIVREALNNVVRHAKVNEVSVNLRRLEDLLQIEVKDNGCGFSAESVSDSCNGLRVMKERVWIADGKLWIDSAPGRGTTITAELPFSNEIDSGKRLHYNPQIQLSLF